MNLRRNPAQSATSFLAALIVVTASQANAAVTEYNDRSAFEAELLSSTLFDFESLPSDSATLLGSFPSMGGAGLLTPTFGDATVTSTNETGIYATDAFGAPTIQIGSQNSGGVLVELSPGYRALGMDIGALLGSSVFDYTLTGTSGVLLSGTFNVADNNFLGTPDTTFFGFISDAEEIVSLEFERADGGNSDFETLDNLIYGNPVPEPATLSALAIGIAAVCLRRRFV